MPMKTFDEYKTQLLDYLNRQKELEKKDIEANKRLSDDEKIAKGLLICDAEVNEGMDGCYCLRTFEDNSKLRIGDKVKISFDKVKTYAKVVDLCLNGLTILSPTPLQEGQRINIEACEFVLLDAMINLLQTIEEGRPGASFLNQLAGIEQPRSRGIGAINADDVETIPDYMDDRKKRVITESLLRPSVYCIQGPPGTGKTAVLSAIAGSFASKQKEVLVLANTHQAVNNALNRIAQDYSDSEIFKIGEFLKAEGLNDSIHTAETFNDFLKSRKDMKRKTACIVGMTLHAAIVNLGLRTSGFLPNITLVDEAGQIPVTQASLVGAFGCGSIVFIGDDRQMPPIFHPELQHDELSKSIFAYLCERYPTMRNTLNVTYRMNACITDFVSKSFYEVPGVEQKILSSEMSANRTLSFDNVDTDNVTISQILNSKESMFILNVNSHNAEPCDDSNPEESAFAFQLAKAAKACGMSKSDYAIITPYRRQVKYITGCFVDNGWSMEDMPLINTVECLQGQDVEMIIISFSASDAKFISQQRDFLFDFHRLNVMISRAKTKVVMLMSEEVQRIFNTLYGVNL